MWISPVQEKMPAFPVAAKLYDKMVEKIVYAAKSRNIALRQIYTGLPKNRSDAKAARPGQNAVNERVT